MSHYTPTYTVLFICQENAGRSLMAEAMLNKLGKGRFEAYSAGIEPAEKANPIAIQLLEEEGFDTTHLRPKYYSVFLEEEAPNLDFVFTLCQDSEEEAKLNICDEMSSETITAHWHFSDPSWQGGNEETEQETYRRVQMQLAQRIKLFMQLPDDKLMNLSHHPEPSQSK